MTVLDASKVYAEYPRDRLSALMEENKRKMRKLVESDSPNAEESWLALDRDNIAIQLALRKLST